MKITAKVHGENLRLLEALRKKGIVAKLVKNGIIAELPKAPRSTHQRTTYEVSLELNGATLLIDCAERGGGLTRSGSGTVVCGLSGKALRPYFTPRGGHLACSEHGYFSAPVAIVSVTGYRLSQQVLIQEHRIRKVNGIAWIKTNEVWAGELEALPKTYSPFMAAAEAASRKANCYHCRCLHYAK